MVGLLCMPARDCAVTEADVGHPETLQFRKHRGKLPSMCLESQPSTALSPQAIALLVNGHREFLAFLERRVESRAVAEDILQAAFTRGLERGAGVQDEKVVAWFYRVLRNAVIDYYRQRSTAARAMEAWGREFPDIQEPEAELRQEICQCVSGLLETLKPEYREALRIVDLEEGKLKDLAQQSGITAENAAVRVHRARAALRRRIEQACGTCAVHGCVDCSCEASGGGQCGE